MCCAVQESLACDTRWRSRVAEFEASIASQLTALKQQHELQLTELLVRCEAQRPSRPQHSAEILNGRKIEETLVKQVRGSGLPVLCCAAVDVVRQGTSADG